MCRNGNRCSTYSAKAIWERLTPSSATVAATPTLVTSRVVATSSDSRKIRAVSEQPGRLRGTHARRRRDGLDVLELTDAE